MQQKDQTATTEPGAGQAETTRAVSGSSNTTEEEVSTVEMEIHVPPAARQLRRPVIDWLALGIVLVLSAFFALVTRLNNQPAPSFVPSAALCATGCGLLVTALRKIRSISGVGLVESALGGFFLAFFPFAVSLTYPEVFATIGSVPDIGHPFLLTWALVGLAAVIVSMTGAAVGHMAFAPLRSRAASLPEQVSKAEDEEDEEDLTEADEQVLDDDEGETGVREVNEEVQEGDLEGEDEEETMPEEEFTPVAAGPAQPRRTLLNEAITVLLLGLLPMMVGYVFAAIYDFSMNAINVDQVSPAFYPTLSLLSGLLPWRLPVPIDLTGTNGAFTLFTLLWRVPDSILSNPALFDVQSLEVLIFNASALALLLLVSGQERKERAVSVPVFLFLELLLGLILVLPSNFWILRGLEGVLQIKDKSQVILATQLPTVHLLNPLLFTLNLVTGPLVCLVVGLLVRRQYQLWTLPRENGNEPSL